MEIKDINLKMINVANDYALEICVKNLADIMEIDKIHKITLHPGQRGFVWSRELVKKLIDDIFNATPSRKHYIGVCKCYNNYIEIEGVLKKCMCLGDFNQRMNIIFLFLFLLNWRICSCENYENLNFYKDIIQNNLFDKKGSIRFEVFDEDKFIFEAISRNEEIKDEQIKTKYQNNLATVYRYMKTELKTWDDEKFISFLENFLENTTFLLKQCHEEPFCDFETENVYRVNLSIMEKLKNLTLKPLDTYNRKLLCLEWNIIFKDIYMINQCNTKNLEEDILRAYLLSLGSEPSITKKDIYEWFVSKGYGDNGNEEKIFNLLKDLRKNIRYYKDYITGRTNYYIYGLNQLKYKQGAPLFMLLSKLLEENSITQNEFDEMCKLIFKLGFVYVFGDELPSVFGSIYKKVIEKIKFEGLEVGIKQLEAEVEIRKDSALKIMEEKAFISPADKCVATYILKAIEKKINTNFNDHEKLELEHVLQEEREPKLWKNLSKETWFEDNALYKTFAGRLGNLTLIKRKNKPSLKEANFFEKTGIYSSYANISKLTYQISSEPKYSRWDRDTIKVRGKELRSIIEEIWFL